MNAKLRRSDNFRMVSSELDAAGIAHHVEIDHKHPHVVFTVGGKRCLYVLPSSSCNRIGAVRARSDIRRIIRNANDRTASKVRHEGTRS